MLHRKTQSQKIGRGRQKILLYVRIIVLALEMAQRLKRAVAALAEDVGMFLVPAQWLTTIVTSVAGDPEPADLLRHYMHAGKTCMHRKVINLKTLTC